jgi:hypothetical protein
VVVVKEGDFLVIGVAFGSDRLYIYVKISGSAKEGRYRFGCIFYSRKEGQRTQNTRKIDKKDRQRANLYVRGIGCPVKITISRYVLKKSLGDYSNTRQDKVSGRSIGPPLYEF